MAVVKSRVVANSYRDSVELMQIAAAIEAREGIERAGLVMATPANRDVLAAAGLLTDAVAGAGPNDLVVSVAAIDDGVAGAALDEATARLTGGPGGDGAGAATETAASTLAEAVGALEGANIVLIATPGAYASAETRKALKRGLHVFLFSDNVPVEDEIELKALARERGLLLMGPDCGTAILDGVPLGFANHVRRGSIGLAAASGTGLQQVTSLIDRFGAGVSQAIGVGGRDLDERVGGVMMIDAIERLAADPATAVIVIISKPPAPSVAERVIAAAGKAGKPVVVNLLGGDPTTVAEAGLTFAATFEDAARIASAMALGAPLPGMGADEADAEPPDGQWAGTDAADLATDFAPDQQRIRGLYSGGSLAGEAKLLIKAGLGSDAAQAHEILDLGDDQYTVGRPHPMIDPRLRNEMIEASATDPTVALILLDVVLGTGAHPDPAGVLVPAISAAQAAAARAGRRLVIVASVCGTDGDPQGLAGQERTLTDAGVVLAPSNAGAARIAVSVAARLSGVAVSGAGTIGAGTVGA